MSAETNAKGINASALPAGERKKLVENIHINFPRFNRVSEKIAHCHQHSKIAAEPICMLITGQTGAGKTTLRKVYEKKIPRRQNKEGIISPILSALIPVPATAKSLVTRLLNKLGDPMAARGATATQTLRLIKLIHECKVELIFLDEFQHFIDQESNHILQTVANWLKDLLNETKVPVILTGMPSSDIILQANAQLERRFKMRERLDPFGWETPAQQTEYRAFLRYLDDSLPLAEHSHLIDTELAFRIYYATGGVIGHMMDLIRHASNLAIARSLNRLDHELLAEAYDECLSARRSNPINPFRAEIEQLHSKPVKDRDKEFSGNPFDRGRKAGVKSDHKM